MFWKVEILMDLMKYPASHWKLCSILLLQFDQSGFHINFIKKFFIVLSLDLDLRTKRKLKVRKSDCVVENFWTHRPNVINQAALGKHNVRLYHYCLNSQLFRSSIEYYFLLYCSWTLTWGPNGYQKFDGAVVFLEKVGPVDLL